jgi:hypothetical protein
MKDLIPLLEPIAPVYVPTLPRDKRAKLMPKTILPALSVRQVQGAGEVQVNCWAHCPADAIALAREVARTVEMAGSHARADQVDLDRPNDDRTEGLVHCALRFRAA